MAARVMTARFRHHAVYLAVWALLALASPAAPAAPEIAEENAVKAAFIYNFAKFSEWPDDPWSRSPRLRICVTGNGSDLTEAVLEGYRVAKAIGDGPAVEALRAAAAARFGNGSSTKPDSTPDTPPPAA